MAVTCQVSYTRRVVSALSPFSVFVHRSIRRHNVLATVDAADIRGLGTARLLCVAELPHSSTSRMLKTAHDWIDKSVRPYYDPAHPSSKERANRDGFVPAMPVWPPNPKKPSWY